MTFEEARAQFPVLERYAYLNAGTFGPMPHAVAERDRRGAGRALEEGRSTARLRLVPRGPARCARGSRTCSACRAEHIALTTSTSEGCNVVLNGLGLGRATRSSRPTRSTSA